MRSRSSSLEAECDRLWQRVIRKLWRGRCAICGQPGSEGHHLIKRRHMQFRHDPDNGVYLCRHHHDQAETRQRAFLKELERTNPEIVGWLARAEVASRKPYRVNGDDLSLRCSSLTALLR